MAQENFAVQYDEMSSTRDKVYRVACNSFDFLRLMLLIKWLFIYVNGTDLELTTGDVSSSESPILWSGDEIISGHHMDWKYRDIHCEGSVDRCLQQVQPSMSLSFQQSSSIHDRNTGDSSSSSPIFNSDDEIVSALHEDTVVISGCSGSTNQFSDIVLERLEKEHESNQRVLAEKQMASFVSELHETRDILAQTQQEREKLVVEKQENERRLQEQMKFKWSEHTRLEWTKEEEDRLRRIILKSKKDSKGEIHKIKILVFGPSGSGKSSLCNGFRSALLNSEDVSHYYQVGTSTGSFSKAFTPSQFGDICIVDMAGIFDADSISDDAIRNIASGNVPFYAKITENLQSETPLPTPEKKDLACVVVVLKAGIILGDEVKRQLEVIKNLMGQGVVAAHIVMTFLDQTDSEFSDPANLPNVFKNGNVQEAVKKISSISGFAPSSISVVKNYVTETVTDMYSNILLLHTLRRIIFDAQEQLEKKINIERLKRGDEPEGIVTRTMKFLHLQ